MSSKKARLIIIVLSGLFLLLDQILKYQAYYHWTTSKLISPYFGWQLFLNSGVAFGLPLSNTLTILITLPMIALIGFLFLKSLNTKSMLAWCLVLAGAISNLFDRIIYHQVVDYFLIGTAVINLGDVLIVGGLLIYLFSLKSKTAE